MICNNCGTQYEDDQAVCPNCGIAAQAEEQAEEQAVNASPFEAPSKNLKDKLPVVIVAAAIVVLLFIIIAVASSGGYKKAVKNMFKYAEKGKSEKLLKLEAPKDVYEEMIDEVYDMKVKEYVEIQDAAWDALWEGLKEEGKVDLSYEIKECENIDKLDKLEDDLDAIDDIDDFIDIMDEQFDDYDFDADKIKKAYAVEVKWTLEVDGDKAASGKGIEVVYKYKGDWYLVSTLSPYTFAYSLDEDDFEEVIEDVSDELEELWN